MTTCILLVSALFTSHRLNSTENRPGQRKTQGPVNSVGRLANKLGSNLTVVFQDSNRNYWFGGLRRKEGVYRFDGKRLTLFSVRDGLCSDSVLSIQGDQMGNLYFDTPKGISRFDGKAFATLKVTAGSGSEWKLEPGDLWFSMGAEREGPYRYDGKSLYRLKFPKTKRADEFHAKYPNAAWSPYGIYTMYKDKSGAMWFGTASLGACRYDGLSHSWLYETQLTTTPSGGDFGIRSIIQDRAGSFWFCNPRFRYQVIPEPANGDQINYRKKPGARHSRKEGVPYFMSIAEDTQGQLWMATYNDGVWRNDGKTLVKYPIRDGSTDVLLFSVYTDRQGVLWLGTHNAGVFRFDGKKFLRFAAP